MSATPNGDPKVRQCSNEGNAWRDMGLGEIVIKTEKENSSLLPVL